MSNPLPLTSASLTSASNSEAIILDGRWLAGLLQARISARSEAVYKKINRRPGLGVILVGDNPASQSYVSMKERYAQSCGLETFDIKLNKDASSQDLKSAIMSFNQNPHVDGILLQLPIPKHLPTDEMLDLILPEKDADGLHPLNQGLMMRGAGTLLPCTPRGALRLMDLAFSRLAAEKIENYDDIKEWDLAGKSALVIGRSILVGKPLSLLLQQRNATVTMAHSRTKNLAELCAKADIVFAAAGSPGLVKADWINPRTIVIDVGTNRLENGKLAGDVEYLGLKDKVAAITPVPGGVGPMTVAMLVLNTLTACETKEL
jgi:methylenetetrahydrofolate dehydrogenase (NADP+)/methenyltetrahydrofolate cyclohydrolase